MSGTLDWLNKLRKAHTVYDKYVDSNPLLPGKDSHNSLVSEKGRLDSHTHSVIPFFYNNKTYVQVDIKKLWNYRHPNSNTIYLWVEG